MNKIHSNTYRVTCRNPDGSIAWVEEIRNLTPNEALNEDLAIFWTAVSPPATWYMLLVDNAGFGAFAATDTAAQNGGSNGWTEWQHYTLGTRPAVVWGSVSGQSVDNSASPCSFTINSNGSLHGAALVTSSTKGGTGGFLGGEGAFSSPQAVTNGQVITIEVTATAASA